MKALAGFIVRGRSQAILVASLSGIVAFLMPPFSSFTHYLGAAVVALVTLYVSASQGLVVLVAATVVSVLFYQLAGLLPATAVAVTVLLLWLPCWVISAVLRRTVSLAAAMLAGAGLGVLVLLLVYGIHGDPGPWWLERMQMLLAELQKTGVLQGELPLTDELQALSRLMTGVVLASLLLGAICSVILARWWQALLVNPGGLQKEFTALRLGQSAGLLTLVFMIGSRFIAAPLSDLVAQAAMLLLVPYLFAGLAVLHGIVGAAGRGRGWLVAVYIMLVILPQATLIVAGGGLLDTWMDFRRRFGGAGSNADNESRD